MNLVFICLFEPTHNNFVEIIAKLHRSQFFQFRLHLPSSFFVVSSPLDETARHAAAYLRIELMEDERCVEILPSFPIIKTVVSRAARNAMASSSTLPDLGASFTGAEKSRKSERTTSPFKPSNVNVWVPSQSSEEPLRRFPCPGDRY